MSDFLAIFRIFLDNLILRNGKATSLGAFWGVVLSGIVNMFEPTLKKMKFIDIEKLAYYHFIAFGIVIMNLPWFTKKPSFSPQMEDALDAIKLAKENGVSEVQLKLMYNRVVDMAIENARESQTPPQNEALSEVVNTVSQNMKG
ncbi:hypothetical protein [Priestia megaterium]|uniref:hypothetical protein n=1 Tax=Priestia megaterium TaxID=1404 RepID=UPI002866D858|nr:hypothetical protein [Priestia megaterium]MDR7246847.1 hypothetical protein [Priestia megaterium]